MIQAAALTLGLIVVVPGAQDAAPTTPPVEPAAALTPAAKVIGMNAETLGGAKAIAGIKNLRYTVTVTTAADSSPMTVRSSGTDRLFVDKETAGRTLHLGRVGDVAFTDHGGAGYSIMSDVGQINQLDLYGLLLNLSKDTTDCETVAHLEFDGTPCDKVRLARDDAGDTYGYFDETGRLLGIDQPQKLKEGTLILTTRMSEYGPVPPLTLFVKATITARPEPAAVGGPESAPVATLEFSNVEFNVLTDADLALPPEVAAMVEASKGPQPLTRPETDAAAGAGTPDVEHSPLVQKMLARLQEIDDLGQLQMMVALLEGQIGSLPEEERADMEFLVEKLKERVKELGGN